MNSLKRTVLITGCSPGSAGNAMAREFHERGYQVFATGRTIQKIAELQELGIECVALELTSEESIHECHRRVSVLLGDQGLDFLINNAGAVDFIPAIEEPIAHVRHIMDVNFISAVQLSQLFLPELRRSRGTIINVGSFVVVIPAILMASYSAAKAALQQWTNVLRLELAPFGVTVRYVQMGGVASTAHTYDKPLPDDSLYAGMNGAGLETAYKNAKSGVSPEEHAKNLVTKIENGQSRWRNNWQIWAGYMSTPVWWLSRIERWWPWDFLGWMMSRNYEMHKLRP